MGLDIYLTDGGVEREHPASRLHPDHMCNRTYLRSSYNAGGFDRVVSNVIGKDLYYIFAPPDDYEFVPTKGELEDAWKRAVEVTNELKNLDMPLRVDSITLYHGPQASSDAEAIALAKEELNRDRSVGLGAGWSSSLGVFHPDGLKVNAFIPGKNILGHDCLYIVMASDLTYYIEMAEIVVEFIEEALSMERPTILWSG